MKKLLLIATFLISSTTMAMPISTGLAIQGLMQNSEYQLLVNENTYVGFDFINIEKVTVTMSLVERCPNFSRSGTILKVTIGTKGLYDWRTRYFSTPRNAEDFILCE